MKKKRNFDKWSKCSIVKKSGGDRIKTSIINEGLLSINRYRCIWLLEVFESEYSGIRERLLIGGD